MPPEKKHCAKGELAARPFRVHVASPTLHLRAPGADPQLTTAPALEALSRFRVRLPIPLSDLSYAELRVTCLLLLAFRNPVPAVEWENVRIHGVTQRTILRSIGRLRICQILLERKAWDVRANPFTGFIVQVSKRGDELASQLEMELGLKERLTGRT